MFLVCILEGIENESTQTQTVSELHNTLKLWGVWGLLDWKWYVILFKSGPKFRDRCWFKHNFKKECQLNNGRIVILSAFTWRWHFRRNSALDNRQPVKLRSTGGGWMHRWHFNKIPPRKKDRWKTITNCHITVAATAALSFLGSRFTVGTTHHFWVTSKQTNRSSHNPSDHPQPQSVPHPRN